MAAKLKKGDRVVLMVGARPERGTKRNTTRGQEGEIIRVLPKEGQALVRGMNLATRHQRQTASNEGGITRSEATIDLSNLALVDPVEGGPTRVGFKVLEDGRKVRYAKKSGKVLDE